MKLPEYFADVVAQLERESNRIRKDFATHHLSAGTNREAIVAKLLREYLPQHFQIGTGLITAFDGQFSNQADLILTDRMWNTAFHSDRPNPVWLVEAVYALLEVKTKLTPTDLGDAIVKGRRFKKLARRFSEAPVKPNIEDSLYIVWGFNAPASEVLKENLKKALAGVPINEQPDFVIVPGKMVVTCGQYHEMSTKGLPGTKYRMDLERQFGSDLKDAGFESLQMLESGSDSLLIWWLWVLSWLTRAGNRTPELFAYMPEQTWGKVI